MSVVALPWKIHCGIDIIPVGYDLICKTFYPILLELVVMFSGSSWGINNHDACDILLCALATKFVGGVRIEGEAWEHDVRA